MQLPSVIQQFSAEIRTTGGDQWRELSHMESVKHQWNEQISLLSSRRAVWSFSSSMKFHRQPEFKSPKSVKTETEVGLFSYLTKNMRLSSKLDRLCIEKHWEREMPSAGSVVGLIGSVLEHRVFITPSCRQWEWTAALSELLRWVSLPPVTASCLRGYFQENGTNQGFSSKSSRKFQGLFLVFLIRLFSLGMSCLRAPLASTCCIVVGGAAQLNLSKNSSKS